jgi:hypothetical protein
MELKELRELVRHGEGQLLEFKHKAAFPEKIVREMVAFANTRGGHLLVGVDDGGAILGLKFAEEDHFALERAIRQHVRPAFRYHSEFIPVSAKKSVLSYRIFEQRRKPVYYLENPELKGKAYLRLGDKSVQASTEFVEILRGMRRNKGTLIRIGDPERVLLQYLEQHGSITLNRYCEIARLPRGTASRILVRLALGNILEAEPGETEDFYRLKPHNDQPN